MLFIILLATLKGHKTMRVKNTVLKSDMNLLCVIFIYSLFAASQIRTFHAAKSHDFFSRNLPLHIAR